MLGKVINICLLSTKSRLYIMYKLLNCAILASFHLLYISREYTRNRTFFSVPKHKENVLCPHSIILSLFHSFPQSLAFAPLFPEKIPFSNTSKHIKQPLSARQRNAIQIYIIYILADMFPQRPLRWEGLIC